MLLFRLFLWLLFSLSVTSSAVSEVSRAKLAQHLASGRIPLDARPECARMEEHDPLTVWKAGTVVKEEDVRAFGVDRCFASEILSDQVFCRMQGKSYKAHCPIPRTSLRYLKVLHRNAGGEILLGEIVCNKAIANDLLQIFRQLYDASYPIERMVLVDDYDANDEKSMQANNTSCFNYRYVSGSSTLSKHSKGMAIDINPLYNPYVKRGKDGKLKVSPAQARAYVERNVACPYLLKRDDLCCQLFIRNGFTWGGDWKTMKDYQHFEK